MAPENHSQAPFTWGVEGIQRFPFGLAGYFFNLSGLSSSVPLSLKETWGNESCDGHKKNNLFLGKAAQESL
jgi:hypothetical protein